MKKLTIIIAVLLLCGTALTACENTYRGAGRDLDNVSDEMEDGFD